MTNNKYIIGLTGQSGAGKSTISNRFADKGFFVINCDQISHDISNRPDYATILSQEFGKDIINLDQSVNRRKLGNIVFNNKEKLELLNKIFLPFVVEKITEIINSTNSEIIVLDAPTLIESGLDSKCDIVVSVTSDENIRLKRIMERDNISKDDAIARIKSQNDEFFYINKSNYVLINNDSKNDLITKTDHLINYIRNTKLN